MRAVIETIVLSILGTVGTLILNRDNNTAKSMGLLPGLDSCSNCKVEFLSDGDYQIKAKASAMCRTTSETTYDDAGMDPSTVSVVAESEPVDRSDLLWYEGMKILDPFWVTLSTDQFSPTTQQGISSAAATSSVLQVDYKARFFTETPSLQVFRSRITTTSDDEGDNTKCGAVACWIHTTAAAAPSYSTPSPPSYTIQCGDHICFDPMQLQPYTCTTATTHKKLSFQPDQQQQVAG